MAKCILDGVKTFSMRLQKLGVDEGGSIKQGRVHSSARADYFFFMHGFMRWVWSGGVESAFGIS
jgi:hypothetical protein